MRTVLSLFLSALLWATSFAYAQTNEVPYQIDEQATANAPWKIGEIVAEGNSIPVYEGQSKVYRKFIGMTNNGYYVVQDFYKGSNKKYSDPYLITQQDAVEYIKKPIITQTLDGALIFWYENGQKMLEAQYQDEKSYGLWTHWYENGQKMLEGQSKDNKEQGLWIGLNENGSKVIEGQYVDGKKQGLWTFWDDNGKKMSEVQYVDGKEQSCWSNRIE